jgi:DNA-directed RNA polymerase subunit K/omega
MEGSMINTADFDQLAEKFGGRFKLTILIQKRLKELVKGGQKLVDLEDRNLIKIVLEEVRNNKVGFEGFSLEEAGAGKEESKKASKKKE